MLDVSQIKPGRPGLRSFGSLLRGYQKDAAAAAGTTGGRAERRSRDVGREDTEDGGNRAGGERQQELEPSRPLLPAVLRGRLPQ